MSVSPIYQAPWLTHAQDRLADEICLDVQRWHRWASRILAGDRSPETTRQCEVWLDMARRGSWVLTMSLAGLVSLERT